MSLEVIRTLLATSAPSVLEGSGVGGAEKETRNLTKSTTENRTDYEQAIHRQRSVSTAFVLFWESSLHHCLIFSRDSHSLAECVVVLTQSLQGLQ